MQNLSLQDHVKSMKSMAETLIPLTYPKSNPQDEQDILLLKQKNITIDGYEVFICFSKSDYEDCYLESIQIQPFYTPFLPFNLICKIACAFLGSKHLSYIEFIRNNKKIYCWTIRSKDGKLIPPDKSLRRASFEELEFAILQPGSIDLF